MRPYRCGEYAKVSTRNTNVNFDWNNVKKHVCSVCDGDTVHVLRAVAKSKSTFWHTFNKSVTQIRDLLNITPERSERTIY